MASGGSDSVPFTNMTSTAYGPDSATVTPAQRLGGVGAGLLGVLGAIIAYTTIRWIGKRAHPLISVNYLAGATTFISATAILFVPGIDFRLPSGLREWCLLSSLGICGFFMQLLLTAGLQYEKSSKASNMLYTQMLFALAFDKLVWNKIPGALSIFGSSLILGSALYVAVQKNSSTTKNTTIIGREEEELGLMLDEQDSLDEEARRDGRRRFSAD